MDQQTTQLIGMSLAAITAGWVSADATRRGLKTLPALGWGVGVFFLLIVFLPLYLWDRKQKETAPSQAAARTAPCLYCEYPNALGADFCEKCGRQLRSSIEIHHKDRS